MESIRIYRFDFDGFLAHFGPFECNYMAALLYNLRCFFFSFHSLTQIMAAKYGRSPQYFGFIQVDSNAPNPNGMG